MYVKCYTKIPNKETVRQKSRRRGDTEILRLQLHIILSLSLNQFTMSV
jgi:hypothetical protein